MVNHLSKLLVNMNFRKSTFDPCVFINRDDNILVATYVDDIIISSKSVMKALQFETSLAKYLKVKALGNDFS